MADEVAQVSGGIGASCFLGYQLHQAFQGPFQSSKSAFENRVLGVRTFLKFSPRGPTMVGRGVCSYRSQMASTDHSGDLLGGADRARSRDQPNVFSELVGFRASQRTRYKLLVSESRQPRSHYIYIHQCNLLPPVHGRPRFRIV